MSADIVVGLQFGDEGKGKVTKCLIEDQKYDYCIRFNGGPNAGHTIYYNGNKLVTHLVPSGICTEKTLCIIGPSCVVDIKKLDAEIKMLEDAGIPLVRDRIKIAFNSHVISAAHIADDKRSDVAGSTHSGIRPVYRDKYDRCGQRIEDLCSQKICGCQVVDTFRVLKDIKDDQRILFEGAQGFMLDIEWGYYPYVTSSHCISMMATTCGYSFRKIKRVYGVCKLYNTYVGNREFQPQDQPELDKLAILGEERGSTTGRVRQCNWLDLDQLARAVEINGVSDLIVNKCDIIEKLGIFRLLKNGELHRFDSINNMKKYITDYFNGSVNIIYSASKDSI